MTFNSMKELENYILSHSKVAIEAAQRRVFDVIDRFLKQFYSEYSPVLYHRTEQLMKSLVKSDIKSTGNGWIAEVYFDLSKLDYSVKTLEGIGTWGNTYKRNDWTKANDAWVLETAMIGSAPHGGYVPAEGKPIWTESLKVLNQEAINILKQELIEAGIPIK